MNHTLNEIQIEKIRKLAEEQRRKLGFGSDAPIANDLYTILDNMKIRLLQYPIEFDGENSAFSAALMYSTEGDEELVFIGLNTAIFFDEQIFAIAHELYHYLTKTATHVSRLSEEKYSLLEIEANRFAAEFLLPKSTLESIILNEFKTSNLHQLQNKTLLRFIARLHCTWWLPYHSLLKRLKEIDAISLQQYNKLYSVQARDLEGEFASIGKAINKEVFIKLNRATNQIGTSPKEIEIIIRNFEDNIIDEDKFDQILKIFDKTPAEFGYKIEVPSEDITEFEDFFNRGG